MIPTTERARPWRTAALLGAVIAVLSLQGLAAPAYADTNGGNIPAGPYTLTITKLKNPTANGTTGNGTQQNVSTLTPISGVNYSIAPVNGVDLSSANGWTTASALSVNSSGAVVDTSGNTYSTGTATALTTTNSSGVTNYTTSTASVYKVTETAAPAGTEIAPPFLVTLPLPQSNNWLTNVFVYPKNTVQGVPALAVDDSSALGTGSTATATWTATSTVPSQAAGNPFTQYVLTDVLDARLTPPAASAVTVTLTSSTGTPITVPAANFTTTVTGQQVSVSFTAAGLAQLTANPAAVISVGLPTTVNSVGNGTIQNTVSQTIQTTNQVNAGTAGTTLTSNTAQTTWGDVSIHKVDPNNNALQGAEFQVYSTLANAQAASAPIAVGGVTTFTTDSSGNILISGLRAQNNGQGANQTYYIVETKAPSGYSIAAAFAQATGGYAKTVAPGSAANPTITVIDPQIAPIALPLTGSTGTAIFAIGGLALAGAAGAIAILMVRRRREEDENLVVTNETVGI